MTQTTVSPLPEKRKSVASAFSQLLPRLSLLVSVALAASGCATKPTTVKDNPDRRIEASEAEKVPTVTKETVIVDARPAFEYSTAHIPRSVPMNWSDFTEPEPTQRGIVQNDIYAVARRLARSGIGPSTNVIVVGRGFEGEAEEGRIAWMLAYLGVASPKFTTISALKPRLTNLPESNPPASVPIWKPQPVHSLNVTKEEVRFAINERGIERPIEFIPSAVTPGVSADKSPEPSAKKSSGKSSGRSSKKASKQAKASALKASKDSTLQAEGDTSAIPVAKPTGPKIYRFIDVRSERAYLGREGLGSKVVVPNMDAVNIPWQEFFTPNMRPRAEIAQRLEQIGVTKDQRVVVLDEDGISSAAVTMALRDYGYEHAGNYAGGLQDLLNVPAPPKAVEPQ